MLLIVLSSFIGSFGAVFLKSGAAHLGSGIVALIKNWRLAAGIFFFLLSSFFFVLGMRAGELTVLYPIVSLGYVWTLVWSRIFFGERITRAKFAGVALILIGVVLVGGGTAPR